MFRAPFDVKRLVLAAILATGFAGQALAGSVETYVDQALPPPSQTPSEGQPLSPGDLRMQDLLKAPAAVHNKSATVQIGTSTQAPAQSSSVGAMLLQGMQSALGLPPNATKNNTVLSPYSSRNAPAASAVAVSQPAPAGQNAPMVKGGGPCTPQVTSWVKSCADAGYPENYVGQIRGETRTTCPQGNLEDVWISNGCVPPDNAGNSANNSTTPLTGPSVNASSEASDANCGAANGLATNARPASELCSAGVPSAVTGEGPWMWSCRGSNGGISVTCAAPVAFASSAAETAVSAQLQEVAAPVREDAQCGASDGVVADIAPAAGLCAKGMASRVNGTGPWTWACSGTNGGRAAACSAQKKIDGVCGSANGNGLDQMPMMDLCAAGYASAVTGNGPWSWTCSGLNGGQAVTCSATARLNAVCGPASLGGHGEVPKNALCSVGQASAVNGTGPWNWTCAGVNGGSSVSCESARSENGQCGAAHGASFTEAPSDELCASGRPSKVAGTGPWSWSCAGSDGGDTASCTAMRAKDHAPVPVPPVAATKAPEPLTSAAQNAVPMTQPAAPVVSASGDLCGSASEFVAIEEPTKDLCKSGKASIVSGHGPWTWACSDHGQTSSCSTLSLAAASAEVPVAVASPPVSAPTPSSPPAPVAVAVAKTHDASCGSAAGQASAEEPSSDLCSSGKASAVSGKGPWSWMCTKGKSRASCHSIKIADGVCGPTNGTVLRYPPTAGLCSSGVPTPVQGSGPWMWSCAGTGGGASSSCSAASQAQTRVDGTCGAAANASFSTAPNANLCDSGSASTVYGSGPWTWTCSGINGGSPAFCSAVKNAPPAPPPPGPIVNGLCGAANGVAMSVQPSDNLCSTGTTTSVSGSGPWNWSCIGENGGMTVSCTAPLQPPAPISGVCGAANGVPTLTAPRSGLCSGGISSAVSGKGPWTWSCSGVNGGNAVGCVAPLAGGEVGALPSMTTTSAGASAPQAAPTAIVKKGLVTPRLASPSLPPAPESSSLPPAPPHLQGASVPEEAPSLPDDTQGVTPPPVRDLIQPAPALRENDQSSVLPGNHFVLSSDLSTIPFAHGSDNYDPSVLNTLSKLARVLAQNDGVRITLTAYADNAGTTPREARRLSLSRALAIRDYLTSKGIASSRIDVRALGANVPSGEPDRVDVQAN